MLVIRIRLLRRFLIGLIAVVSLAVLVNYIQSRRRGTPRPGPKLRSSVRNGCVRPIRIEYTSHKDGVKTFTLQAQKLLETREGKQHLQGIEAHDFNPDGSIRNRVHSQTAVYDTAGKRVFSRGKRPPDPGPGCHADHGIASL